MMMAVIIQPRLLRSLGAGGAMTGGGGGNGGGVGLKGVSSIMTRKLPQTAHGGKRRFQLVRPERNPSPNMVEPKFRSWNLKKRSLTTDGPG
jgi:hypothetical protein